MGLRDMAKFVVDVSIIALLGVVYVAALTAGTLLAPVIRPVLGSGPFSNGEGEEPLLQG